MRGNRLLVLLGAGLIGAACSLSDSTTTIPGDDASGSDDAGDAAPEASDAASDTGHAASDANDAASDTNDAASDANDAASDTNDAASDANDAASDANDAASDANDAASDANDAASDANDAASDASDAGCGTCPPGFMCAPGGYCATSDGVPAFDHVYVIVMENRSLSSIQGNSAAPYINQLMTTYSLATNYNSVAHPSLPNYVGLTSGDTQGIACDCAAAPGQGTCNGLNCNLLFNSCSCDQPNTVAHLGDQLDALGVPWREYGESMGQPCNLSDNGNYAVKHIPFLYYDSVQMNSARCALRVRDYSDFANADRDARTYRFSFISPNLCDDMHDSCAGGDPIAQGDAWLKANAAPIVAQLGASPRATDALFIVWDEQDNSVGSSPIALIVVSPRVKPGSTTARAYDHYALLATIEAGFGVPKAQWLKNAGTATPIGDVWR